MDSSRILPPHQVDATCTRLLVQLARQEPEAWRKLVRVYGPVVRYWVVRAGLNKADLADVFQEVFLAVHRNIADYQRQSGVAKFRAWLKAITHSKVQDHHRRKGKQPQGQGGTTALQRLGELEHSAAEEDEADPALAQPEDAFIAQRTVQLIRQEFREGTWKAFELTTLKGLTSQQAAAQLGISPLAVRKAKSRVLQRLKEALAS
jgi:RNA polymerase sigma-70 factor (ECF subfamily)